MARLPRPALGPGNLKVLMDELHQLHDRAGLPSVREIARHQDFSRSTVYKLFTESTGSAPRLTVLMPVVEWLAERAPRTKIDPTLDFFDQLWTAAKDAPFGHDPTVVRTAAERRTHVPVPASRQLGAVPTDSGTSFALHCEVADRVELCLLEDDGRERRVSLTRTEGFLWRGHEARIGPGQRYGFRVHGPFDPTRGHRCNPAKLLLDPYARAVIGDLVWTPAVFGHRKDRPDERDDTDSAPFVPWSVVVDPAFDWAGDRPPRIPHRDSLLYEVHVRGMTIRHPDVPPHLRGTFAGLADPAVVAHLQRLGVTAVQLMPVQQFVGMIDRTASPINYWGYGPLAHFAPHAGYASSPGEQVAEFKAMVRDLHAAGIEVIIDMVLDHTAEGDECGPTLCLRGIDNRAYYRLRPDDHREYTNFSGVGNNLDTSQPTTKRLLADALRYWVTEMHVDGFRFNLAPVLARDENHRLPRIGGFLDILGQDPILNDVKLIAEPWDLGDDGRQVGNFPAPWREWNDCFRNDVRDFWRGNGQPPRLTDFASRILGSADLYRRTCRGPDSSINFVTVHDGFTLADLVSYNTKHNERNGEKNADGTNDNRSWNCGIEGPTQNASVLTTRDRQQRAFLGTLLLSHGVPMMLHGDEVGRSQNGNNNAYCHDDATTWMDWLIGERQGALLAFTAGLTALRKAHSVFRRDEYVTGKAEVISTRSGTPRPLPDATWFSDSAEELSTRDLASRSDRFVMLYLNGGAPRDRGVIDDDFLICFNSNAYDVAATLPGEAFGSGWSVVVDTATGKISTSSEVCTIDAETELRAGSKHIVRAHSLTVLQCCNYPS